MDEMTDYRQEEAERGADAFGDPVDNDERRRYFALDQAIRHHGSDSDADGVVKTARTFEAFLKGD